MGDTQKLYNGQLVLVITANHERSSGLNAQLSKIGLKPVFVSNAEKGLSVLRHAKECATPIALTLFDHDLTDAQGLDYIGRLRQDPLTNDSNVIIITTETVRILPRVLEDWKVDHMLVWPCEDLDIINAVSQYIPLPTKTGTIVPESGLVQANQSYRILCADDNTINLAVLKGFLNIAGYSPDTVTDGREAVRAYKNMKYDLILMDIMMPVMDGVVATLQIRELEKQLARSPVPIVAVTAHCTPTQKERYIQAGMNDVIEKPISKKVIDKCLEQWCSRFVQPPPAPLIKNTASLG